MPDAEAGDAANRILHWQQSIEREVRRVGRQLCAGHLQGRGRHGDLLQVALRGWLWRHDSLLPPAGPTVQRDSYMERWLLRGRKHRIGIQHTLEERRVLPHRLRHVPMRIGHLGQRDQWHLHGHGGDERQLQQRRRERLYGR